MKANKNSYTSDEEKNEEIPPFLMKEKWDKFLHFRSRKKKIPPPLMQQKKLRKKKSCIPQLAPWNFDNDQAWRFPRGYRLSASLCPN